MFLRKGTLIQPMLYGGSHERQRRAGTENLPGIVGLGKAAEIARKWLEGEGPAQMSALRDHLQDTLLRTAEAAGVNGLGAPRVHNTTNLWFDFIEGEALVIDYKYSAGNKVRERVEESEAGNLVQAGLYMLAAERAMGLKPIGMLYCGVKKETSWGGWRLQIAGLERIGEGRTRQELRELMEESAQRAREVHTAITTGKVAVRPLDGKKCAWCDFQDACRVETMAAEVAVAGTSRPV